MKKVTILDYGIGNLKSVQNAFEHLSANIIIAKSPSDILDATSLVLPGVGAFSDGMKELISRNLVTAIQEYIRLNKPLLGICLGMQLLADKSEERGNNEGLSFISGEICKIPHMEGYRLPHVGWNDVTVKKKEPLFKNIIDKGSFYFVHSYRFECDNEFVVATTNYGQNINAVVQKGNVFGVQFHPERSQRKGLHLINNFVSHIKTQKYNK